jgi:hypothetical protein
MFSECFCLRIINGNYQYCKCADKILYTNMIIWVKAWSTTICQRINYYPTPWQLKVVWPLTRSFLPFSISVAFLLWMEIPLFRDTWHESLKEWCVAPNKEHLLLKSYCKRRCNIPRISLNLISNVKSIIVGYLVYYIYVIWWLHSILQIKHAQTIAAFQNS